MIESGDREGEGEGEGEGGEEIEKGRKIEGEGAQRREEKRDERTCVHLQVLMLLVLWNY